MLFSANKRRDRIATIGSSRSNSCAAIAVPLDTEARLCALAQHAREQLAPWVALPLPEGVLPGMRAHELPPQARKIMSMKSEWFKGFEKVGEHEGCGILLLVAKLDPQGTGRLDSKTMQSFFQQVESTAENVLSFATTCMIVCTLVLAIVVPLTVWPISKVDERSPSLGGGWPYGAAWYDDWLYSPAMQVVHWAELLFLAASIFNAFRGTMLGFFVYAAISIYAPDTESKMMVLYDNYKLIATMTYGAMFGLISLLVGLIFLTARCSPVACIMMTAALAAGMKATMGNKATMKGTMVATALNQLRLGREIVGATVTEVAAGVGQIAK